MKVGLTRALPNTMYCMIVEYHFKDMNSFYSIYIY